MQAKILSLLLTMIVAAGILLAGATTASAQTRWFFEIQASGKGVEADTDVNGPTPLVYNEGKHTLDTFTLYAMYIRAGRTVVFAFYVENADIWSTAGLPAVETEKSVVPYPLSMTPVYIESPNGGSIPIYGHGTLQIQYKETNGVVKSARLKSLGMAYQEIFPKVPTGSTYRFGTLKMKGRKIAQSDVPPAVLTAFGL